MAVVLTLICQPFADASRTTADSWDDTVSALISLGRWQDATWLCQSSANGATSKSLAKAKWTARHAKVSGEQAAVKVFSLRPSELLSRIDGLIDEARKPISSLLPEYSNADESLFLSHADLLVRQRILTAAVIASSVSSTETDLRDGLLRRMARLESDLDDHFTRARSSWTVATGTDQKSRGPLAKSLSSSDFQRVMQETVAARLSLSLLQSELFTPGSADYRAAATDAARKARDATLLLPDDSEATDVATQLLGEALLRSGARDEAERLIGQQLTASNGIPSPAWLALRVRLDLQTGNESRARQICDLFYRSKSLSTAAGAPASTEMDFARLEVLLASEDDDQEITNWIDTIERRGGPFSRRRAESMAIRVLRGNDTTAQHAGSGMNPALVAAQGEAALREKDPQRAAGYLKQAALAEGDPAKASTYAAKAAAAAIAAGDLQLAIESFRETARLHSASPKSSELMMQAALMISKGIRQSDDPAAALQQLEDTLTELYQTWPSTDSARKANQWHCRLLEQSKKPSDAARAALEFLTLSRRADQLSRTLDLWFAALSELPPEACDSELASLSQSLLEMADESESLRSPIETAASWLFDVTLLRGIPRLQKPSVKDEGSTTEETFLITLARFRAGETEDLAAQDLSDSMAAKTLWRLKRDALNSKEAQPRIGRVLKAWPGVQTWDKLAADWWSNPTKENADALIRLATTQTASPQIREQTQDLFRNTESSIGRSSGVDLSDRLAAKQRQGSLEWTKLKLDAIRLLAANGDTKEAQRRAAYILLTRPPQDPKANSELQKYAGQE